MLSFMKLHGKPGITAIGCYGNRHGLLPFVLVRSHRYHVTLPPPPFFFFFSVSTSPQNGTTCMCCMRMKYFILESGHHTNSSVPVLRNWLPNLSSIIFFVTFVQQQSSNRYRTLFVKDTDPDVYDGIDNCDIFKSSLLLVLISICSLACSVVGDLYSMFNKWLTFNNF